MDLGVNGALACGLFANSRTKLDLSMGRKIREVFKRKSRI